MTFDFMRLSERELFEIWKSTNSYEWNDLLGPKPDGFDELPDRSNKKNCRSKSDYTKPIWAVVNTLIGAKRLRKLMYEEKSSYEKAAFILSEYAMPGTKIANLAPILEHFAKTLDLQ